MHPQFNECILSITLFDVGIAEFRKSVDFNAHVNKWLKSHFWLQIGRNSGYNKILASDWKN